MAQDDAKQRMVQDLVARGWVNDDRMPPQSDSAQAFTNEVFRRRVFRSPDEVGMFPELASIILSHNGDPNDTDVIGTVIELIDYCWDKVL